jgi:hypothetical protein
MEAAKRALKRIRKHIRPVNTAKKPTIPQINVSLKINSRQMHLRLRKRIIKTIKQKMVKKSRTTVVTRLFQRK